MERLTIRNKYGDIDPPYQLTSQYEEDDWNSECREKLAYYEDLDESGRLFIVGEIVYQIKQNACDNCQYENQNCMEIVCPSRIIEVQFEKNMLKNIFLTRDEANEKLKEMK